MRAEHLKGWLVESNRGKLAEEKGEEKMEASLRVLAERETWATRVVSSYGDGVLSMQSFYSSCMDSSVIAT